LGLANVLFCVLACHFFISVFMFGFVFFTLSDNGLQLGEEADFEALNCLPAMNLI
jgi:hypothetical protein